jgi:hypothetical protein
MLLHLCYLDLEDRKGNSMIRSKKEPSEIVIDLTGPDGNAFALLTYAGRFARQLGMKPNEIESLQSEMISGDYENLIKVFDRHFGDFVVLER